MRPLLIVDGYNLMWKSERYRSLMDGAKPGSLVQNNGYAAYTREDPLEEARRLLIADVAAFAQHSYEAVVVFDASGNLSSERQSPYKASIRIVFSKKGEYADTVIERLATEARQEGRKVTLVTSDNTIRATVGSGGISRLSSDLMAAELKDLSEESAVEMQERSTSKMTLESRLSPEVRKKLWDLLKS